MNKKAALIFILIAAIFGILYVNNHQDSLQTAAADYYFKKNDLAKAQKHLEKAFDLGLKSPNKRNLYVNSIINSPLDINAQKKMAKFLGYNINDSADLKAKYFLYDLKREIFKNYPDNYISQAVYNQKIIRWGKMPVTYNFVQTSDSVPDYFIKEIENAFTEWEKATSHIILFSREEKNPNIIIKFSTGNSAVTSGQKFVTAYTSPSVAADRLKNMTINFYLKNPQGEYYPENRIYNTALHEIAHALGFMGHSYDKKNIMYLTGDSMPQYREQRAELTPADINTIKLLYKIKPDITNVNNPDGEYMPYLIIGGSDEVINSKIKEAKNYIKKAPYLPGGYIDLAEGYVAAEDYSQAIKCLEKALELADSDDVKAIVYYNLAVSYYYIGHAELALSFLQKSEEIRDSEEIHYLLAEIYIESGDEEKAIQEYKNLLANYPKNIEYTISLANIYVTNHSYIKARNVLKNYINSTQDRNNPRLAPYGIIKIFL